MAARAVRTSATDHFAIISGIEKIATDIYSFENLRKGGYVYVDKTDLLWRLASERKDASSSSPVRGGSGSHSCSRR